MIKTTQGWPVGICSWSLGGVVADVATAMERLGVTHVHLDLRPAVGPGAAAYLDAVQRQGWTISATMVGFPQEDYSTLATIRETGGVMPDDVWPANLRCFKEVLARTADLGVARLSMHAGFFDHADPERADAFRDRVWRLADLAGERGVQLLLETGQESAADLRSCLETLNHAALGINFDPANMILYDKDQPVQAVGVLGPWIRHVHIKDAVRTTVPGTWGAEVPWGDGQVGGAAFLAALQAAGYQGTVAIEREAGGKRLDDMRLALDRLQGG